MSKALHNDVAAIAGNHLAFAVNLSYIREAFAREIALLATTQFNAGLPIPAYVNLRASISLNVNNVTITPDLVNGQMRIDATFRVILHLPTGPADYLGQYDLDYQAAT